MATLLATCTDGRLVTLLRLRATASKYLSTYVDPWLEAAEKADGRLLPTFNQVACTEGGTRTGRFSCASPNLQNIPVNAEESRSGEAIELLARELEAYGIDAFMGLRHYLLPDPGYQWAAIDYSQQELRMLAHFEQGALAKAFRKNPKLDVHSHCRDLIQATTGHDFPRKAVKTLVFGVMYGMGLERLADATGLDVEQARTLRMGFYKALPGVREIMDQCSREGSSPAGMRTLGGRVYHTEDPLLDGGGNVVQEFGYKNLNYCFQGSAADYTKGGMRKVAELGIGRIAVQVHDELGVMVKLKREARRIAETMCDQLLGVPMLADIKMSRVSWGAVH